MWTVFAYLRNTLTVSVVYEALDIIQHFYDAQFPPSWLMIDKEFSLKCKKCSKITYNKVQNRTSLECVIIP